MEQRTNFPYGRYAESEYLQWLNHKQVIIVGPAGYLLSQRKGKWIDGHEVVIRINHALPIKFPQDYGSRTDVLYHILSRRNAIKTKKTPLGEQEILLWKKNIKWLVCRHSNLSTRMHVMAPLINSAFPWTCMNYTFYKGLKREIGEKSPNTGITAIMHALQAKVKTLTVVGFDLYESGVYPGYGDAVDNDDARKTNDQWHSSTAQREYLSKVIKRDNRLIIDDTLKGVLSGGQER